MHNMALWMDHDEARVFHVEAATFDETTVHSANQHIHRHPKDEKTRTRNHPDDEHRFFHEVATSLASADQILLVGPSVTKLRFLRYVQKDAPALESHIVGIETADHPTDRRLVAHVRHYFHSDLRRRGTGS
jgi:stalled ribosome rescue protein Dom34